MNRFKYLFNGICLMYCLMLSTPIAYAQLNLANGYASGQWYNPARDGEGFELTNNVCHAGRYDDLTATPAQ